MPSSNKVMTTKSKKQIAREEAKAQRADQRRQQHAPEQKNDARLPREQPIVQKPVVKTTPKKSAPIDDADLKDFANDVLESQEAPAVGDALDNATKSSPVPVQKEVKEVADKKPATKTGSTRKTPRKTAPKKKTTKATSKSQS